METLQEFWHHRHVTGFRRVFYLVTPNETSFETVEEVPNYFTEVVPYVFALSLLENLILLIQGKSPMRLNDGMSNIAHGALQTFNNLLLQNVEVATYIWVYDNWRLYSLPWNSALSWVLCFLGMDLGYYWVHRCMHEVNIMWAGHQVHHSSEDFNMSVGFRLSATRKYFSWMFYLPMALFIPPSLYAAHNAINLIYQFWLHTEVVGSLGPLGYILNTPSHHRVHHGRNPYCIDKNYGGVLIIWDRIFGTFQAEEEKVVYGLVHPLQTWDVVNAQFGPFLDVARAAWSQEGVLNTLGAVFKGPGWQPGKPRLGLHEDLPQVTYPVQKYDSRLPWWGNLYVWLHFALLLLAHNFITANKQVLGPGLIVMFIIFFTFTVTAFSALHDNKRYGPALECVRCVLSLALAQTYQPISMQITWGFTALRALYILSAAFWAVVTVDSFQYRRNQKKIA